MAEYADGIGPDYHMLVAEGSTKGNIKLTGMVQDAHQNKMVVHPYTSVPINCRTKHRRQSVAYTDILYTVAGVDGPWDFPDKAVMFLQKNDSKASI